MANFELSHLIGVIASVIRERRLALDRSQEDVAHEAGLSVRRYAQLESGGAHNPTLRSICSVCTVLNIDMDGLLRNVRLLGTRARALNEYVPPPDVLHRFEQLLQDPSLPCEPAILRIETEPGVFSETECEVVICS